MAISVFIVSCGARTPLGRYAAASATAYRAGINAAADHPFLVSRSGEPMPAAMDSGLDADLGGASRLLALAGSAIREACEPLMATTGRIALPLVLALPEIRPGFTEVDVANFRERLQKLDLRSASLSSVDAYPQGHAAGVAFLDIAAARVRTGEWPMCLVGGVDSYLQAETMEWLDECRQVLGPSARAGFIPGEAAGACLLADEEATRRYGLKPLASVVSGGVAEESRPIKGTEVSLGEGMTRAVSAAIREGNCFIDDVYCDQNGERYRGEEWGFVCLRLGEHFRDATDYHAPADGWGDVGAASGPLFAMLACQATQRGYAQGPVALLCAGSEGGLRSAVLISRRY